MKLGNQCFELERDEARNLADYWRKEYEKARIQCIARESSRDALAEALKPFAECGDAINRFSHFQNSDSLWGTDEASIRVGDLRRASRAYLATKEKRL